MSEYFAYQEAEAVLDAYALNRARPKGFLRSYKLFKWGLAGIACYDFNATGGYSNHECMAFAWEDAEVAFRGYGEPGLTGLIISLWNTVPEKQYDTFERIIVQAFNKANKATSPSVQRRYQNQWRLGPIRRPEQGFTLPTVIPTYGPPRMDWSKELSPSVEIDEKEARRAESNIIQQPLNTLPEKNGPGPQLRIVR